MRTVGRVAASRHGSARFPAYPGAPAARQRDGGRPSQPGAAARPGPASFPPFRDRGRGSGPVAAGPPGAMCATPARDLEDGVTSDPIATRTGEIPLRWNVF